MKEMQSNQRPEASDLGWDNVDENAPIIPAGPTFTREQLAALEARLEAHVQRQQAELDAAWNPESGEYEY